MNTTTQALAAICVAGTLAGCSELPNVPAIPPVPHTEAGALDIANRMIDAFGGALGGFMVETGIMTDELTTHSDQAAVEFDKRNLTDPGATNAAGSYMSLQSIQTGADLAIRSLRAYAPTAPAELRGRLYAMRGYSTIMLAELFCSGVPLSTVDLNGAGAIYGDQVSRDSLYYHAIAFFDSTLALAGGNDSLKTLARVGKGRALLGLGQFAEAAQTVADVAEGSHYGVTGVLYGRNPNGTTNSVPFTFIANQVVDHEGENGLSYRSSHDPRTLQLQVPDTTGLYAPSKYIPFKTLAGSDIASVPLVLADWVEARLIQAEAALHANDVATWLQILNHLRAAAPIATPDTHFQFDTPIALTPLTDPGTLTARVDTMFAERAAWLYLTGHRQGDLRRLIRQYGRVQSAVYPTGPYVIRYGVKTGATVGTYGSSVTSPIPLTEQANPKFHGCLSTGA